MPEQEIRSLLDGRRWDQAFELILSEYQGKDSGQSGAGRRRRAGIVPAGAPRDDAARGDCRAIGCFTWKTHLHRARKMLGARIEEQV